MLIGIWLPYSPFSEILGLVALPITYWFWIAGFLLTYGTLTHFIKSWFFKKYGDT
jgi:Mg2+-importing ATPase